GVEEGVVKLVGLSQNPRIVRVKRFFRRTDLITLGAEEGTVTLVGLPKNPMVVGCKISMGIPRDEEDEVHLVELRRVVGCKKE
ncbi:hypothetical protein A2U01_0086470, partial [Trifolium medium]|nr:hypothetical protein [Trifolium medium]